MGKNKIPEIHSKAEFLRQVGLLKESLKLKVETKTQETVLAAVAIAFTAKERISAEDIRAEIEKIGQLEGMRDIAISALARFEELVGRNAD